MKRKITSHPPRPVLVCIAQDLAALESALPGYNGEAVICSDIPDLCNRVSEQVQAAIIGEEMLSPASIVLISQVLQDQPEWSDLPILIVTRNDAIPTFTQKARQKLGNVFFTTISPATLDSSLHSAFRSRERQRHDWELAEEYKQIIQDLQDSRRQLEQTVRDRTDKLRKLTGELILSEQQERRRLAAILHDHLQQLLVSAKYRVASLTRAEDANIQITAQEVEDLLGEVIEASRSLTSELSPPIIHESSLRKGIEWLSGFMSARNGIPIQLKAENEFDQIDDIVKVLLFESTRELLSSLVKNTRMQSAELLIEQTDDEFLQIRVAAKGAGSDAAGFNLFRISERLKLIGGNIEVKSKPGKGVSFLLRAPSTQPAGQTKSDRTSVEPGPQSELIFTRPGKPVGSMIRVLVADDHAVMRQGLSTQLSQEPDIVIIGEAANGLAALKKARDLHPDVVLMDLGMPEMNGVEATQKIHSEMPDIRVIGLSIYDEQERANAMYAAGAVAYLSKSCSVSVLTAAIRRSTGKPEYPAARR
jgi:CheY-like chemotaxis protein/signal transduction histidine kinase